MHRLLEIRTPINQETPLTQVHRTILRCAFAIFQLFFLLEGRWDCPTRQELHPVGSTMPDAVCPLGGPIPHSTSPLSSQPFCVNVKVVNAFRFKAVSFGQCDFPDLSICLHPLFRITELLLLPACCVILVKSASHRISFLLWEAKYHLLTSEKGFET